MTPQWAQRAAPRRLSVGAASSPPATEGYAQDDAAVGAAGGARSPLRGRRLIPTRAKSIGSSEGLVVGRQSPLGAVPTSLAPSHKPEPCGHGNHHDGT